jgi:hypothetical protein
VLEPARERLRRVGFCDADGQPACASLTFCELQEAGDECHRNQPDQPKPGWCYVDPETQPGDDPSLVKNCEPEHRTIRFVDPEKQTPAPGTRVVIACAGAAFDATDL